MRLPQTLINFGWRYLLRRPWQSLLMLLGIALGVAVVVAVDLANASASRAFDLSVEAVAGRATHQIVGGPRGLDETVYVNLRREGVLPAAAPLVSEYVSSPQLGNRPLQLLGVDLFAEPPLRDFSSAAEGTPLAGLIDFFTRPGAILISADLADRYGLEPGARISLQIGGYERQAFVAGLLEPTDDLSRRTLAGIILSDVATAQELTGRLGRLDRVDLVLPGDDGVHAARIRALLPQDVRLLPVGARTGSIEHMAAAFGLNLTALSLLALLVGIFLIYNTMTFSVVQRRPLFGTLRCLGVTRREIAAMVLSEALVVGTLGAALGLMLGIALGRGTVRMVTQTINDLYFVVTVRDVDVATTSLLKGGLLGVAAPLIAAGLPAWEAASVPPRAALSRSGLETKARRAVTRAASGGCALTVAGAGVLALPTRSLVLSFAGTSAVILGFAMLTPLATRLLMRGATPLLGRVWGSLGRMAPRDVINSLSRTFIAVAALMVAMAVTIGVSLMIGSFRHTVTLWLSSALQGDIYISASNLVATQDLRPVDPALVQIITEFPEVARVELVRSTFVDSPAGPVFVEAGTSSDYGYQLLYHSTNGSSETAWEAIGQGAAIVSEPLANRLGLTPHGGTLTLYTDQGLHTFPVSGIYYDYASSQGKAIISLALYRQLWHDDTVTALALDLAPGADPDRVATQLQEALNPVQRVMIRPNRALREEALAIFDRTFAITGALQLLATAVAFIGVLSALMSLLLEKRRQLGILRGVGLTVRQLYGLVMLETGLMGTVAGLLAMPAGLVLSLILVYIINRRSFGWTLLMHIEPAPFIQALGVAVIAALLAGVYPAYRTGKTVTVEALRFD